MCGIVGYVGPKQVIPILMEGLNKLEYRGYDSAGVAVYSEKDGIQVIKAKGRLSELAKKLEDLSPQGTLGIGHTRWATHGEPSDENSHPHVSGEIAVVHNGIIENYMQIKSWLVDKGYEFVSQTDTEVVAHLIAYHYDGNLKAAVQAALKQVRGSYALGVLSLNEPDKIVCARKDSPLVVGIGDGENFIASDIPALLAHTRDVYLLEEGEIAVVTVDSIDIYDQDDEPVNRDVFHVTWDVQSAEKGGYSHFMIKEINEEPKALTDTIRPRIKDGALDFSDLPLADVFKNCGRVVIVGCGSAYHVGIVGKYIIEKLARVSVEVDIASEFRYRSPILNQDDLFIVISQSGETADTLAALRTAKAAGVKVLAVANVVGSTIAREADSVFYTWAGPEIAVATTKAYATQIAAVTMIGLEMGYQRGHLDQAEYKRLVAELEALPTKVKELLSDVTALQKAASRHFSIQDAFFIGRGLDYAAAMESSLKLKEISYIHSEALAAGELKHGTIALISEGTLVVGLLTQDELREKTISNIKEVIARRAYVTVVAAQGDEEAEELADSVIFVPKADPLIMPLLAVIPAQVLAYYCAVELGYDPDKPRNLAKSVTVE